MPTPNAILDDARAEPFRSFRIHMASGRTFDVRHPKMIKVLKSYVLIFKPNSEFADLPDEHVSVSLMLAESVTHPEAPVR